MDMLWYLLVHPFSGVSEMSKGRMPHCGIGYGDTHSLPGVFGPAIQTVGDAIRIRRPLRAQALAQGAPAPVDAFRIVLGVSNEFAELHGRWKGQ